MKCKFRNLSSFFLFFFLAGVVLRIASQQCHRRTRFFLSFFLLLFVCLLFSRLWDVSAPPSSYSQKRAKGLRSYNENRPSQSPLSGISSVRTASRGSPLVARAFGGTNPFNQAYGHLQANQGYASWLDKQPWRLYQRILFLSFLMTLGSDFMIW